MQLLHNNETYHQWVERVRLFEYGLALQRIANGDDQHDILEDFSIRVTNKIMHSFYLELKKRTSIYDEEKSKLKYKQDYLDKNPPKADHVLDQ
jgi:glutamyl-tRNA reductase